MAEQLTYTRHEVVSLRGHPQFNEKWVQDIIAKDPSILGLGELELRQAEKIQPSGGRLDLLLSDPDSERRYEVELMLGALDESHIIRTLEYWDIERRRFPQHDHCAVIVAERITSRFINVVQLFNRTVPLIAIQMQALRVGDQIVLHFATVLDEFEIGGVDDEPTAPADRPYWEQKGSPATVVLADKCLEIIREFAPQITLRYNKHYIGFAENGVATGFAALRPKKQWLLVDARTDEKLKWNAALEGVGLPVFPGGAGRKASRFRVTVSEIAENRQLLREIFAAAYKSHGLGELSIELSETPEEE